VNPKGYVLRKAKRSELPPLPDFHALRHGAAMDCDDAEEARDLLRHKNSNVTRYVYRAHFSEKRREALRTRMEARMEVADFRRPAKLKPASCADHGVARDSA
jgi:integrase